MKKVYYAVKWGNNLRITYNKHYDVKSACRDCYGLVAENMTVKPLGGVKTKIQNKKWLKEQTDSSEGWEQVK